MLNVLKSPLPVEDKNLLAHTIRTAPAHQAYLLKAKQHNRVLIVFEVIPRKKAATRVSQVHNQSMEKALALETLTPIHHVAFDVVNKNK